MSRFASEEFVIEVATWLEKVAKECRLEIPFQAKNEGKTVTTSGIFIGPSKWPVEDWQKGDDKIAIGVLIPLARLMRHCNLTEEEVLQAVELAKTSPEDDLSIYIEKDHEGADIIRLSKIVLKTEYEVQKQRLLDVMEIDEGSY